MARAGDQSEPVRCRAPQCRRAAVARGLCMKHYKRERAGRPLTENRPGVGTPDGYGQYGVLDDDGDTVGCHECGARVAGLGGHIQQVHPEMTVREYKITHGLPLSRGLSSTAERERRRATGRARVGTAAWRSFEVARDPEAAAAARDSETMRHAATVRDPELAIRNGRAGRLADVRTCPICGALWCPLPGGYRRVTCGSPDCAARATADSVSTLPRHNAARDARIYLQVRYQSRDVDEVAAEHGISRERVLQIVRTRRRAFRDTTTVEQLEAAAAAMVLGGATDAQIRHRWDLDADTLRWVRHDVDTMQAETDTHTAGENRRWGRIYLTYLRFVDHHGRDPRLGESFDGVAVGQWIVHQRKRRYGKLRTSYLLPQARIRALDAAQVDWTPPIGRPADR